MASPQPPAGAGQRAPAQVVASLFVQQYYKILQQSPDLVYRFYDEDSRLGRPSTHGADEMDSVTTIEAINEKIMGMDVTKAEIKSVDSQDSFGGGVTVLVTGHLTGADGERSHFLQFFFLAPQEKGYFVLNDMFRYIEDGSTEPSFAPAAVAVQLEAEAMAVAPPLSNGTAVEAAAPDQDTTPLPKQPEEHPLVQPEENVHNPPSEDDAQGAAVEEEQPVQEVIDEVTNNVAPMMTTTAMPIPQGGAPKKSYASIVKVKKEAPLPAPVPSRPAPAKPEKQATAPPAPTPTPTPTPAVDVLPLSDNIESTNIQEPEVDAHAIYVRSLPLNATPEQLEEEFKQFGTIKPDGIQVRSHKIQGFCYGFVEFEEFSSVQSAMKAKSVMIGGRECFIEEKRTHGSRGSGRGRFPPGRSNSFRTEGVRGRGNYAGGRSYRSDYGGRSGGRGGSVRGADAGYQRVDRGADAGYQRVDRGAEP